jgi:radical SAM protein with 4Fe4S-binding SPASM domain
MTISQPSCMAPFSSIVIDKNGELLPCCDFMQDKSDVPAGHLSDFDTWWNQDLQVLRNKMISYQVDSGCDHCLKKEADGQSSLRLGYNNRFSNRSLEPKISEVEIRLGNYCNLRCIMCGDYASSSIATEYSSNRAAYNKLNIFMSTESLVWWKDDRCMNNLKTILEQVEHINFAGGEPFIVPEMANILTMLNPQKIKNIGVISSLNNLSLKILKELDKFKSVGIAASIEGVGAFNDYIRNGSNWGKVTDNVKLLKQKTNIHLNINHVLQHTSIWTLPELIDWADKQNLKISLSGVYYHSYPAPGVLTIDSVNPLDLDKFKDWLSKYNGEYKAILENWINQYKYDHLLNQKFHQYMSMLDNIRSTDFKLLFNPTYENP